MNQKFLYFLFGVGLSFILLYFYFKNKENSIQNDYEIITNQISKMNKMVVIEQDFSSFQTHKSQAAQIAGYDILPKEMVLYSTAKAQVSYDLTQMKMEVDSTAKKIIIHRLPNADIKIFPEVKIHFMDDYAVNRFDKTEINQIIHDAKENMKKSVNQNQLKTEGKKQLMQNLKDILVLAKALNYSIEDQTQLLDLSAF